MAQVNGDESNDTINPSPESFKWLNNLSNSWSDFGCQIFATIFISIDLLSVDPFLLPWFNTVDAAKYQLNTYACSWCQEWWESVGNDLQ